MNPVVIWLFQNLDWLTGPLRGYRTAIGVVALLAGFLVSMMNGDYAAAYTQLAALLALIGVRPPDGLPPVEPA